MSCLLLQQNKIVLDITITIALSQIYNKMSYFNTNDKIYPKT